MFYSFLVSHVFRSAFSLAKQALSVCCIRVKRQLTTLIQRKALAYVLTPDAPLVGVEVVAAVANVFDKAQW